MVSKNFAWLDACRGLAAVMVAAGHLRALMFVDFSEAGSKGILSKTFYFLTGLGHEAVMVFFVLSGFFIGRSIMQAHQMGTWSWRRYATARLVRLWIVLLPALLLTFLWDALGGHILGAPFYTGAESYHSAPTDPQHAWTVDAFFGNLFFLQTIVTPPFGSNGPLWSLSNEFWYYVIFPFIYFGLVATYSNAMRVCLAVMAAGLLLALPLSMIAYGSVWLMGAVVAGATVAGPMTSILGSSRMLLIVSVPLFAGTVVAEKALSVGLLGDLAIGVSFALVVYTQIRLGPPPEILRRTSTAIAAFSYTLYLTHLPFLVFCSFVVNGVERQQVSLPSIVMYLALLGLAIAYAVAVYSVFEVRTHSVQAWFTRRAKM